ncbi:MAG TPA: hypothetical protein VI248_25335 [Kineosporiaceae bacterium]
MATNLLLEGDDLEALLIRAHSEGGPNARIVRADKYRHGGLWGFFARERFEVAVEISERSTAPDVAASGEQGAGSSFGSFDEIADRTLTAGSGAAPREVGVTPSPVAASQLGVSQAALDAAGAAIEAAASGTLARSSHRYDTYADPCPAAARSGHPQPAPTPLPWTGGDVRSVPATPSAGHDQIPPALRLVTAADRAARDDDPLDHRGSPEVADLPGAPAAGGLLGVADRVSAAERAAARAVQAMRSATASAQPQPGSATITLPRADLVGATLASMAAGDGGRGPLAGPARPARSAQSTRPAPPSRIPPAPRPVPAPAAAPPAAPAGPRPPARPGPGRDGAGSPDGAGGPGAFAPGTTARLDTGPQPGPETLDPLDLLRAVAAEKDGGPHEPSRDPVRPSTTRPEFTALLDQLRDGARSGHRIPGRPADQDPGGQAPPSAGPAGPAGPAGNPTAGNPPAGGAADVGPTETRTAADRSVLRGYGVPAAWTRRFRSGDRFTEVLRMLEHMPDPDIAPDAPVVAVVGPGESVRLEAHRTAVDLAVGGQPRPVVVVPAEIGTERASAITRALRSGPVVLAVETDRRDAGLVLDTLTTVRATAVIAVVDAAEPLPATQRWLDALGQVDALALEGGAEMPAPASALQLGVPVIRFDGIPVDRVTWTALLCARLVLAEQAAGHGVGRSAPHPDGGQQAGE